jgi:sulfate permease, SulP family
VVGLYAAPAALLLYAALGSSRHLVTGPMSATAALSAATVGDLVAGSGGEFVAMTTALAVATGIAALLAGLLRRRLLRAALGRDHGARRGDGLTLAVGLASLAAVLGLRRFAPAPTSSARV